MIADGGLPFLPLSYACILDTIRGEHARNSRGVCVQARIFVVSCVRLWVISVKM